MYSIVLDENDVSEGCTIMSPDELQIVCRQSQEIIDLEAPSSSKKVKASAGPQPRPLHSPLWKTNSAPTRCELSMPMTRFSTPTAPCSSDPLDGQARSAAELANSTWSFPRALASRCSTNQRQYIMVESDEIQDFDSPPPEEFVQRRHASVLVVKSFEGAHDSDVPNNKKRKRGDRRLSDDDFCIIETVNVRHADARRITDEEARHAIIPHQFVDLEVDDAEELGEADLGGVLSKPSINDNNHHLRLPKEGDLIIDLDQMEEELLPRLLYVDGRAERRFTSSPDRRKSTIVPDRARPIKLPLIIWDEAVKTPSGYWLQPGNIVEVVLPGQARKNATFLFIKTIIRNVESDNFTLRGLSLLRTRDTNGVLSRKCNELVLDMEVDLDDSRTPEEQAQSEVYLKDVWCTREVRFTNQGYPAFSFRTELPRYESQLAMEESGPLVVRWKFLREYPTAKDRCNNTDVNKALIHLREEDLVTFNDRQYAVSDFDRREMFRGMTTLGGSHNPDQETPVILEREISHDFINLDEEEPKSASIDLTFEDAIQARVSIDLTSSRNDQYSYVETGLTKRFASTAMEDIDLVKYTVDLTSAQASIRPASASSVARLRLKKPITVIVEGQKYTYGDSFCGGGGATRGAIMADLLVKWGLDNWEHACETWKKNFPGATILPDWADQIVQKGGDGSLNLLVDILHLSPPCQFWSPAHTVAGRDDDTNSASLFACGPLLKVVKPRIATLEQTFGLASPQFQHFFHALIRDFTDEGYSVRWKIVTFADWGLPARRHRLIMIASCPGERLPSFPPQTHAAAAIVRNSPHLRPHVTVSQTLAAVPVGPLHNPAAMRRFTHVRAPWNANDILPRCMTTSGGQNYHPSGLRDLTLGEFAALQGFPPEHRFGEVGVKKIIGNSVPPVVAQTLFGWIRKWLEEEDGVVKKVITLDD